MRTNGEKYTLRIILHLSTLSAQARLFRLW